MQYKFDLLISETNDVCESTISDLICHNQHSKLIFPVIPVYWCSHYPDNYHRSDWVLFLSPSLPQICDWAVDLPIQFGRWGRVQWRVAVVGLLTGTGQVLVGEAQELLLGRDYNARSGIVNLVNSYSVFHRLQSLRENRNRNLSCFLGICFQVNTVYRYKQICFRFVQQYSNYFCYESTWQRIALTLTIIRFLAIFSGQQTQFILRHHLDWNG